MPDPDPRPAPLVPLRRLGPALAAQRVRRTTSFAELSRASGRRWRPDELREVERASRLLDDASVADIVGLYDLPARPLPDGRDAEVILDRSSASDLGGGPTEVTGLADAVTTRLGALGLLCGFDAGNVAGVDEVIGLALTMSPTVVAELLAREDPAHLRRVERTAEALAPAVVVPAVGVLVGETDQGALVLTRRRRGAPAVGRPAAAAVSAGPIGELLDLEPSG